MVCVNFINDIVLAGIISMVIIVPLIILETLYILSHHKKEDTGVRGNYEGELEIDKSVFYKRDKPKKTIENIIKNKNNIINNQPTKGLQNKYIIQRTDGTPINPENEYFILKLKGDGDPVHINACRVALLKYANEIESYLPELAKDLREKYS